MSTSSASSTNQEPGPDPERGDDRASLDDGEGGGILYNLFGWILEGPQSEIWEQDPPAERDDSSDF